MTIASLILFILTMYFILVDEDVKVCLIGWGMLYCIDATLGETPIFKGEYFYGFAAVMDVSLLMFTFYLKDNWKRILIQCILWLSALLNVFEQMSYYETPITSFVNTYQWVSIELMLLVLLWKTKVRDKHDIFRISRDHTQS